jgi:[ribosomal protein S5]-alanine N-acetyltransferase
MRGLKRNTSGVLDLDRMETSRTILKKTILTDFDLFFKLYGNEEVMKMTTGKPFSLSIAKKKFKLVIEINSKYKDLGYFGIYLKDSGEGIGMAKIVLTHADEAEIGYVFMPGYWGLGFGTEITMELVNYARTLNYLSSLTAIIDPDNVASKKILLKCGFELEKVCEIDKLPAEVYRVTIMSTSDW